MKKPAHTPTKSIRGDAQPQEKGKDTTTHPASPEAWMQPTAGDAQPQANRAERQDTPRQDERHERQDTRQVGRRGDKGSP
jgi:hypothetical protein